jgi:hypothetical protein
LEGSSLAGCAGFKRERNAIVTHANPIRPCIGILTDRTFLDRNHGKRRTAPGAIFACVESIGAQ